MSDPDQSGGSWTLLTGHGRVLVEIGRDPGARIRDISAVVGLAERTVQAIVADLEAAGYLTRTRTGRRVRYTVNHDSLFRHPAQEGQRVGPFLSLLAAARPGRPHHTGAGRHQVRSGAGGRYAGARLVSSPEPARGARQVEIEQDQAGPARAGDSLVRRRSASPVSMCWSSRSPAQLARRVRCGLDSDRAWTGDAP